MTRIIKIDKSIHEDNKICADRIRKQARENTCFLINIMGSPGCGKTSLIIELIKTMRNRSVLVIEGDVDSDVDARKIISEGFDSVQIQTGGACHLDAYMLEQSLMPDYFKKYDFILIENIGNLICTSGHDIGADLNIVLLSVPEGDDKPMKYPAIFKDSDAVIITKHDYIQLSDFSIEMFRNNLLSLKENAELFITSSKQKTGFEEICSFIITTLKA